MDRSDVVIKVEQYSEYDQQTRYLATVIDKKTELTICTAFGPLPSVAELNAWNNAQAMGS